MTSPCPQRWRHLERFGSTTRIRRDGGRLHPDTNGLTMATFRQTTSRADDPQIHTHAVISAKVQTADGRWYALDARYLKKHQRMLGGLYQSVLRAELTDRFGVEWRPIVNGQAEIAGVPNELIASVLQAQRRHRRRPGRQGRRVPPPPRPRPVTLGTRRADPGSIRRHPRQEVRARRRRSGDTVADRSRRRWLDRRPARRRHRQTRPATGCQPT